MKNLAVIERTGEDPKFDHSMGEEFLEIDHAASTSGGCIGFALRIGVALHLANQ